MTYVVIGDNTVKSAIHRDVQTVSKVNHSPLFPGSETIGNLVVVNYQRTPPYVAQHSELA